MVLIVSSRSFGKIATSVLSVILANSPVMDSNTSGSTMTVRSELLEFCEAVKIAFKLLTSSLILMISTVEHSSTFGACQTAGSPSHNLDASPNNRMYLSYMKEQMAYY